MTDITKDSAVEAVARAIAKADGLDFNEICGHETDADYCNSGTCIAAYYEDHDADVAREGYMRHARAAIAAMHPTPDHSALLREMVEALEWYANPEIYEPHPHGPAFDNRDLSFHAIAALRKAREVLS